MNKLKFFIAILGFLCIFTTAQAQDFSEHAKVEIGKNNFLPAIEELTTMLASNQNNETVLTYRANFYQRSGQSEKALADATKVLLSNPKNVNALVVSGSAKMALQKYQEAVADFSSALALQPKLSVALVFRAQAYFKNKDYQKAIADLNTAIKNDPKQIEAYLYRARILADQQDFAGAIADYTFITQNTPQNSKPFEAASRELVMSQEQYLKLEKQKTMQEIAKSIEPKEEDIVDKAVKQADKMSKDVDAAIQRGQPILEKFSKYANDLNDRLKVLPKDDHKGREALYKEINSKMTVLSGDIEKEIAMLQNIRELDELRANMQGVLPRVKDIILRTRPYAARYYQYVEQGNQNQKIVVDDVKKFFAAYDEKDQANFPTYKKTVENSLSKTIEIITTAKRDLAKFNDSQYKEKDDARMSADLDIYTKKLAEVRATNL